MVYHVDLLQTMEAGSWGSITLHFEQKGETIIQMNKIQIAIRQSCRSTFYNSQTCHRQLICFKPIQFFGSHHRLLKNTSYWLSLMNLPVFYYEKVVEVKQKKRKREEKGKEKEILYVVAEFFSFCHLSPASSASHFHQKRKWCIMRENRSFGKGILKRRALWRKCYTIIHWFPPTKLSCNIRSC